MARPTALPVRITRDEGGAYSVLLNGVEIRDHLLAVDGVRVEFINYGEMPVQPTVTLRFAPGATMLDFIGGAE